MYQLLSLHINFHNHWIDFLCHMFLFLKIPFQDIKTEYFNIQLNTRYITLRVTGNFSRVSYYIKNKGYEWSKKINIF